MFASGYFLPEGQDHVSPFIARFDNTGNLVWRRFQNVGARVSEASHLVTDETIYTSFQTQTLDYIYNLQYGYFRTQNDLVSSTKDIQQLLGDQLRVFPNPVSDRLYIETDFNIKAAWLASLDGRMHEVSTGFDNSVDLSNLSSGPYVLVVVDEIGKRYLAKVMVIH